MDEDEDNHVLPSSHSSSPPNLPKPKAALADTEPEPSDAFIRDCQQSRCCLDGPPMIRFPFLITSHPLYSGLTSFQLSCNGPKPTSISPPPPNPSTSTKSIIVNTSSPSVTGSDLVGPIDCLGDGDCVFYMMDGSHSMDRIRSVTGATPEDERKNCGFNATSNYTFQ